VRVQSITELLQVHSLWLADSLHVQGQATAKSSFSRHDVLFDGGLENQVQLQKQMPAG
jgi:hypothetical protein